MLVMLNTNAHTPSVRFVADCCELVSLIRRQQIEPVELEPHRARIR